MLFLSIVSISSIIGTLTSTLLLKTAPSLCNSKIKLINLESCKTDFIVLNFQNNDNNSNGLVQFKTKQKNVEFSLEGSDAYDFRILYNKKIKTWVLYKAAIIFDENIKQNYQFKLIVYSPLKKILVEKIIIIKIKNTNSNINQSIAKYLGSKNYL